MWYESLVTLTREPKIRFFWSALDTLSSPSLLPQALRGTAVKPKGGISKDIAKNVFEQLVPVDSLIDNAAVITNCGTFLR